MDAPFWQSLIAVREAVNKVLEQARADSILGSGLEANVTLFCDEALYKQLNTLKDELRFVLITSTAKLSPISEAEDLPESSTVPGLKIHVEAASAPKCARCWHRQTSVGNDAAHPALCARCVDNVAGEGGARRFA